MDDKRNGKSWTISDELWEKVKDEIPAAKGRDPKREYKNQPGQGRKRLDSRKVLSGIFYVLRTGCQWKAVPKEFGSGSSLHRYFKPHIVPRGEEKKQKENNPDFKARRWVVEVLHSHLNCFRKLLVRYEKKSDNYLALIHFACAVIVWRKFISVHQK